MEDLTQIHVFAEQTKIIFCAVSQTEWIQICPINLFVFHSAHEFNMIVFTAGRAKKEMAKTLKQEAMALPIHVWGILSP